MVLSWIWYKLAAGAASFPFIQSSASPAYNRDLKGAAFMPGKRGETVTFKTVGEVIPAKSRRHAEAPAAKRGKRSALPKPCALRGVFT